MMAVDSNDKNKQKGRYGKRSREIQRRRSIDRSIGAATTVEQRHIKKVCCHNGSQNQPSTNKNKQQDGNRDVGSFCILFLFYFILLL
jgi:hypothetical protein